MESYSKNIQANIIKQTISEEEQYLPDVLSANLSIQRRFELIDIETGTCGGRYYALSPKSAVLKMYNRMYQIAKINNQFMDDKIIICFKESTIGTSRKIYAFEISRKYFFLTDKTFFASRQLYNDHKISIKEIDVPIGLQKKILTK